MTRYELKQAVLGKLDACALEHTHPERAQRLWP